MNFYTNNSQGDTFKIVHYSVNVKLFLNYYILEPVDTDIEGDILISVDMVNECLNDNLESEGYSHAFHEIL